jgi:hypothetical protein
MGMKHGMRRQTRVTDMRNHPRRQLSSQRGEDSRENTILRDGVRRISTSITRCGRDGRNYLEITEWDSGKNWRVIGLSMLKGQRENRAGERCTNQTWKTNVDLIPDFPGVPTEMCSLEMMVISQTVRGRTLALKE